MYSFAVPPAVKQETVMILERQHGEMFMVDIKKFCNHRLGSFAGLSDEDASSAVLSVGPVCVCALVRDVFSCFMATLYTPGFHSVWLWAVHERTDDLNRCSDRLCGLSWSLMAEFTS